MKNKFKLFINFLLIFVLFIIILFIPIKKKKILNTQNKNYEISLNDRVNIYENININYSNIDGLSFKIYKKSDIKNKYIFKQKYNKIPEINFQNEKIIIFKISNGDREKEKIININTLNEGENVINIFNLKFNNMSYKDFNIKIYTNNVSKLDNISLNTTEYISYKNFFTINDEEKKMELEKSIYVANYNLLFIAFYALISSLYFIIYLFKNNINFKMKFKTIFLLEFIITIIFGVALLRIFIAYSAYNFLSKSYLILAYFLFLIFLILVKNFISKEKIKIEYIYVFVALFAGILYCISIMPNSVPDERDHYYIAYDLAENGFKNNSNISVPINFNKCGPRTNNNNYKCLYEIFSKIKYSDEKIIVKSTAESYSKILYIVPSLGIKTTMILNVNLFYGYYLARILNLILTVIIGYFSIKIIPNGKHILTVLLLNPMYLHQGMSISADVLTNSISILFFSYIMFLYNKKYICRKDFIMILLFAIIFIFLKKPYFLLFILLISLIKKKINIKKIKKLFRLLIIFIVFYLIITNINYTTNTKYTLMSIIRNPIDYIFIMYDTLRVDGMYYFENTFGSKLASLQININKMYIYLYLLALLLSLIYDKIKLSLNQIIIFIITTFIIINVIFGGFLIFYSDITYRINEVYGIQGRYFLPILPILLFLGSFILKKIPININIDNFKYNKLNIIIILIHFLIILQCFGYY